jgi:hypothetical protein
MTAADIVADVRTAIACLVDVDDPAVTRVAHALDMWLRGTDFEVSLGLVPGWRQHAQHKSRRAALQALVALFPQMNDEALGRRIVTGVKRASVHRARPGGEAGFCHDLARAGFDLADRTCRAHIAEIRGRCKAVISHADEPPSTKQE